jgi:lipid-A-disaccharide synthase
VAPELIQEAFTEEALAARLGGWLSDPAALARQREGLAVVREKLGGPGASERTARALLEVLA